MTDHEQALHIFNIITDTVQVVWAHAFVLGLLLGAVLGAGSMLGAIW